MMTPEELEERGVWETEEPDNPTQIAHQRAIIARQQEELNEMRQEMETWRRQMIDVRRTMAEQGINLQVRRQVDESPLVSPLASTINMERQSPEAGEGRTNWTEDEWDEWRREREREREKQSVAWSSNF